MLSIEQTLHGYSDGHRLLASSIELPRNAKQIMLTLSDMSGRSMVSGFESYLTGYPIPDQNLYAFARTWYAPEMERPGCVWTHTLLINNRGFHDIDSLTFLAELFCRPSQHQSWDRFTHSLTDHALSFSHLRPKHALTSPKPEISRSVMGALYLTADRPVLVAASDAQGLEGFVLAVWSQQWAGLRSEFTFCTGAISSRSIGSRPFDLQVVPRSSAREVQRQVSNGVFVDSIEHASNLKISDDEWLRLASSNFLQDTDRWLFRRLPISQQHGREAFVPLTELFLCSESSDVSLSPPHFNTLAELVYDVGERFPSQNEARALKLAIAGSDPWLAKELVQDVSEQAVLETLATTRSATAYDLQGLSIQTRGSRMWATDPDAAKMLLSFLIRHDHNSIGEVLLYALMDNIDIKAVDSLSNVMPGLAATIVRRDPSLATRPEFWRRSYQEQREIFDAATDNQYLETNVRSAIVYAMLDENSDLVVDKVFQRFGSDAVDAVLTWYDRNSRQSETISLKQGWIRSLAAVPGDVARWLTAAAKPTGHTTALAACLLNPHTHDFGKPGVDVWERSVFEENNLSQSDRLIVHGFALALAFDNVSPRATDLVRHCFDTVHEGIATEGLNYDLWQLWFDDILPSLSWGRNWDKCERLRRGLIRRIIEFTWPAMLLSDCTSRLDTFEQLLNSCWHVKGGRQVLEQLNWTAHNSESKFPKERRAILLHL